MSDHRYPLVTSDPGSRHEERPQRGRAEQRLHSGRNLQLPGCTGIAASWCPVHGDCSCPRDGDGEIEWHYEGGLVSVHGFAMWGDTAKTVTHYAEDCPIHGDASDHARAAGSQKGQT